MKTWSAFALAAAAGFGASANAGIFTQTSFEASEGYVTGDLANQSSQQGGMWREDGPAAASFAVVDNAGNALVGSRYIESNTATWGHDSPIGQDAWIYYPAWDRAANPIVHCSVAMRVNTPTGTNGNTIEFGLHDGDFNELLAVQVRTATNQLVVINDAGSSQAFGAASGPGGTWLNQYLTVDTYLNYTTGLVSISINGMSLDGMLTISRAFSTEFYFRDADLTGQRTGFGSGGAVMRFDNYLVEVIPAPSSVALLGLGGLVATRRRGR